MCTNIIADLWHYTSIKSASLILESETFKITHFADLKDQSEFLFGLSEVKKAVASNSYITNELNYNPNKLDNIYQFLAEENEKHVRHHGRNGVYEYYILSFTQEKDSQYHWDNFCKNHGCALGFNVNTLAAWIGNINNRSGCPVIHYMFLPCLYMKDVADNNDTPTIVQRESDNLYNEEEITDSQKLQQELDSIIDEIKNEGHMREYFKKSSDPDETRFNNFQICLPLENELIKLALRIKKSEFRHEQEFRIVFDNSQSERTITDTQCIFLPKMNLRVNSLITEIVMSPDASIEDEEKIKDLIEQKGLHIKTHRSNL